MNPPKRPRILAEALLALSACAGIGVAHVNALATQSPGKEAWEELNPASEAYRVMKRKCQQDAGEQFFASREGVNAIYHDSDDKVLSYITATPESYGIGFTNPPYMYLGLGLYHVEYKAALSAIRRFQKIDDVDGYPYRRFNVRSYDTEPRKERSTSIRVNYSRTTTTAEEELGVHGRLIEVIDDSTKTILAQRRDYIWLNPTGKGPHGGFVCPSLRESERLPTTFLNKAINVKTYTCTKDFQDAMRARRNKWNYQEAAPINAAALACSNDYYK